MTRVEIEELQRQQLGWSLLPTWYYRGSDAMYDYFAETKIMTTASGRYNYYRVRSSERAVAERFALTRNEDGWRPCRPFWDDLFSSDAEAMHRPIDMWEPLELDRLDPVTE